MSKRTGSVKRKKLESFLVGQAEGALLRDAHPVKTSYLPALHLIFRGKGVEMHPSLLASCVSVKCIPRSAISASGWFVRFSTTEWQPALHSAASG